MEFSNKKLSVREAKEIDIVDYLSSLGYEPEKIRASDYWYLSPLRNEKTASFKVNRKLNRWYDHGIGKGGNLIDFGILFYNCSVAELLYRLPTTFSFDKPVIYAPAQAGKEPKITIVGDYALSSISLMRYLEQRGIPVFLADWFCRELRYELGGKIYYGIGFKNDSGGYEIRNPYFKGSSAPKDITTFNNSADEIAVFEGFMDFLSFLFIHLRQAKLNTDFVILNSVSFFEKARPFMEQHHVIRLFLDRDTTGQNFSRHAVSLSQKYKDESSLYTDYKDLNDWLIKIGRYRHM